MPFSNSSYVRVAKKPGTNMSVPLIFDRTVKWYSGSSISSFLSCTPGVVGSVGFTICIALNDLLKSLLSDATLMLLLYFL
jgi:hypothetical protein